MARGTKAGDERPKAGSKAGLAKQKAAKPLEGPRLVPVWNLLLPDGTRLGEDRIRLLREIQRTGSLLESAGLCGVSYRTAWSRVQELNDAFDRPLVESVQGGAEGGRSRLSDEAARLLRLHATAQDLFRRAEAEEGLDPADARTLTGFQKRLSMRTSVRNQILGVVRRLDKGAVSADVELEIQGGDVLVARLTLASAEELSLRPGVEAWALVKASKIEILREDAPRKRPAGNSLAGVVATVQHGTENDEVSLLLAGGATLVASASAAQGPLLRKGVKVWAQFSPSDVILAVN